MNLFQSNTHKNEFVITERDSLESDGDGFTLLTSSDDFSIGLDSVSDELTAAITEYGGGDVADGYSVQVI